MDIKKDEHIPRKVSIATQGKCMQMKISKYNGHKALMKGILLTPK